MKHTIIFILLSTFFYSCNGQPFSGLVVYEQLVTSNNKDLPSATLQDYVGNRHYYYLNNGQYKMATNGLALNNNIYLKDSLKLYSYTSNEDSVFYQNVREEETKLLSYEFFDTDEKVLGYELFGFRIKTDKTESIYYFTKELQLDWKQFRVHHFSKWDLISEQMRGVPLKYIIKNEFYNIEGTALKIEDDVDFSEVFILPENKTYIKMPKF